MDSTKGGLSTYYVENIISIEDVTELAKKIGNIHSDKNFENVKLKINALVQNGDILKERPYFRIRLNPTNCSGTLVLYYSYH